MQEDAKCTGCGGELDALEELTGLCNPCAANCPKGIGMKLRIESRRLAKDTEPMMVLVSEDGDILPGQFGGHSFHQEPDGTQLLTVTFKVGDGVTLAPSQPGEPVLTATDAD